MENSRSSLCFGMESWDIEISNAPLYRRAWVLQELLFSPRILHVGGTQHYWECREQKACETFPRGRPGDLSDTLTATSGKSLPDRSQMVPPAELYFRWEEIVGHYTDASLTCGTDRLIAISGIAKEMRHLLADEYLAGLWRSDILSQLGK